MTNNDDTFRWDCIKGTRAIKDEIYAEFQTIDALIEHLVNQRNETFLESQRRRHGH